MIDLLSFVLNLPLRVNGRERDATRERNRVAWDRPGHSLDASVSLVATELRFHLPPSATDVGAGQRLSIKVEGGGWFGRKTYHIVAVSDFTPDRLNAFLEAARRLHGHLEPAPIFRIYVFSDAGSSPASVGVFDVS